VPHNIILKIFLHRWRAAPAATDLFMGTYDAHHANGMNCLGHMVMRDYIRYYLGCMYVRDLMQPIKRDMHRAGRPMQKGTYSSWRIRVCADVVTRVQKHTTSLLTLCREKGATEEELAVCKPRRRSKIDFSHRRSIGLLKLLEFLNRLLN